jgi:arsenate reductase (thioredoxin)
MSQPTLRCLVCGKVTAARMPRDANGVNMISAERYPRRHRGPNGRPCPGNDWPAALAGLDHKGSFTVNKPLVLFLCTGNSARSQMAEAFLRHYGGDRFEAASAGTEPKGINPLTIRVMEEVGISLDGQLSKSLKEFLGHRAVRHAVFVCSHAEQNCPAIWPFTFSRLSWPFDDPAAAEGTEEERLEKFRMVRDQIRAKIVNWLEAQPD